MTTNEIQRALDQMVDSIDTAKLGEVMGRQMTTRPYGAECSVCGQMFKNLRGRSVHARKHRA